MPTPAAFWRPKIQQHTKALVAALLWMLELDGPMKSPRGNVTSDAYERLVDRYPPAAQLLAVGPSDAARESWTHPYGTYWTNLLRKAEEGAYTASSIIARDVRGKRTYELISLVTRRDLPPPPEGFDCTPAANDEPEPTGRIRVVEMAPPKAHVVDDPEEKLRLLREAGHHLTADLLDPNVPPDADSRLSEPDVLPFDVSVLIPRDDSTADDKLLIATALINRAMIQYATASLPTAADGDVLDRLGEAVAEVQRLRQRVDQERQAKEQALASAHASRAVIDGLKRQNAQLESNLQAALRGRPIADDPASRELMKLITGTPGGTKGDQTAHGHRGAKHRG
jgi:hypothetical protein